MISKLKARKIAQQQATQQLEMDMQCLKQYDLACQKGSVSTEIFTNTMGKASVEAQGYATNIKSGTGSAQVYANQQKIIQSSLKDTLVASRVASVGINVFKAALNSIIFFSVIEGVQLLIKGLDKLILTADEAEESANSLRSSMQSFFDEISTNNKTISSISNRFDELSKHVDKNGKVIDLTEEEYSEFLDICNQVKGIMPELITSYTTEGDAIVVLTDKVDTLSDAYKNVIKSKAAMFISQGDAEGNTIQSFFDDYKLFTEGEGGLFSPSAGGAWNNKSTDYEDYYGYDDISTWLNDVVDLSLDDLQSKMRSIVGTTQATYLYALLKENDLALSEISSENYNQVQDVLNNRLTVMEQGISTRVSNIQMSLQQMLYADKDYWNIDDENVLSVINSLFTSVDNEFIKQNNLFSQTAAQAFESNMLGLFTTEDTKQSMLDLYTPPTDDESVSEYVSRIQKAIESIQTYCIENGIEIPVSLGDISDNTNDLASKYDNVIKSTQDKFGTDETYFFTKNSINTTEEIDNWLECAKAANSAADAEQRYLSIEKNDETPSPSISSTIDQLNTQLKPAFDSLASAYQEIFTSDGFTLENVDLSMLSDIQSVMEGMKEAGFGIDTSNFENFAKVLSDSSSTADEVQGAFNSLAHSIINVSDFANMSSDDINVLVKSLENIGLTNAEEVLQNIADAQEEITSLGYDLPNMTEQQAKTLIDEDKASENAIEYLRAYMIQKQLASQPLNTLNDVLALESLCNSLGVTGELLQAVISLKSALGAVEGGAPIQAFQSQIDAANAKIAALSANGGSFKYNFNDNAGNISKSAQSAADTYVEAFEKELSVLDDLKDRGKITEKQYLDALRSLYVKYFSQKQKYLDKYEKYEHQYLSGMKSLYESAFSYITKQIDKRIDELQNQSDSQIEGMENQKKAAEEMYQAQIDAIDEQIKAIDKQISKKQEEIDAINDAADARKRELDLQKAQYDLERMQNQKTSLVYNQGQGLSYQADTSGIRDAREEVGNAKREIQIGAIEEEIKGLEKQKDLLDEQKESLEAALEASNAYWDAQIEQTQKHFDSLISGMEDYKSRWQELAEIEENAKMSAALEELGISEGDILNMSEEAFQRVKDSYLAILTDLYSGNEQILEQVARLSNLDFNNLTASSASADSLSVGDGENTVTSQFDSLKQSVNSVTNAISGSNGTSEETSDNPAAESAQENTGNSLNAAISTIKTTTDAALGSSGTDGDGAGAIGKFGQLKTTVASVTDAIGSDSSGKEEPSKDNKAVKTSSSEAQTDSGTLTGAIQSLNTTTDSILGEAGGEGVIGRFEEFKNVIGEANEQVKGISEGLDEIDGKHVECTITINVEHQGTPPFNVLPSPGSTDYTPTLTGTAKVEGDWAVHGGGESLVGELGQEMVVRNGRFFTVGNHGAEMISLYPGDIVFNHIQTRELLKNGHISSRGLAYTDGTFTLPNNFSPVNQNNVRYAWLKKFDSWLSHGNQILIPPADAMYQAVESIDKVSNLIRSNAMNQSINVNMGDIHLHEVQDANTFSKELIMRMPNLIAQEIHRM